MNTSVENFAKQFIRDSEKASQDHDTFGKFFDSRNPVEIQADEILETSGPSDQVCDENLDEAVVSEPVAKNIPKPDSETLNFQKKLATLNRFVVRDDADDDGAYIENLVKGVVDYHELNEGKIDFSKVMMEMTGNDEIFARRLVDTEAEAMSQEERRVSNLFVKEIGRDMNEDYFRKKVMGTTYEPGFCNKSAYEKLENTGTPLPSRMERPYKSLEDMLKTPVEEDDTAGPDIVEIDEPYEESESLSSDDENTTKEDAEKKKPIVVNLKKGFSAEQIKTFISGFDAMLNGRSPESVTISTEEWISPTETRRFPLIPAAKKLFARFSEAGLLACLVARGQNRAAAEVFCIAYCKAKQDREGNVTFGKIDVNDFAEKVIASEKRLSEITKCKVEFRQEGTKIVATAK